MKKNNCDLCLRKHLKWDTYLFENNLGIYVINSKPYIKVKGKTYKVKKRFTVQTHEHIKVPPKKDVEKIQKEFIKYLHDKEGLTLGKDYEFFITLSTYPDHWHMHACVFPFKIIKNSPRRSP